MRELLDFRKGIDYIKEGSRLIRGVFPPEYFSSSEPNVLKGFVFEATLPYLLAVPVDDNVLNGLYLHQTRSRNLFGSDGIRDLQASLILQGGSVHDCDISATRKPATRLLTNLYQSGSGSFLDVCDEHRINLSGLPMCTWWGKGVALDLMDLSGNVFISEDSWRELYAVIYILLNMDRHGKGAGFMDAKYRTRNGLLSWEGNRDFLTQGLDSLGINEKDDLYSEGILYSVLESIGIKFNFADILVQNLKSDRPLISKNDWIELARAIVKVANNNEQLNRVDFPIIIGTRGRNLVSNRSELNCPFMPWEYFTLTGSLVRPDPSLILGVPSVKAGKYEILYVLDSDEDKLRHFIEEDEGGHIILSNEGKYLVRIGEETIPLELIDRNNPFFIKRCSVNYGDKTSDISEKDKAERKKQRLDLMKSWFKKIVELKVAFLVCDSERVKKLQAYVKSLGSDGSEVKPVLERGLFLKDVLYF